MPKVGLSISTPVVLAPSFVEALMGVPIGTTVYACSVQAPYRLRSLWPYCICFTDPHKNRTR